MSTPREQLAEAIKGRSDDEILAGLESQGGVEAVLDMTFDGQKTALNPDKAQDVVIGYELSAAGKTYPYAVVIKDKAANIEKREPSDARVTMVLTVPDYLRLISGQLDGMQAFMSGKLKLKGDMMFAQQIQTMFNAT